MTYIQNPGFYFELYKSKEASPKIKKSAQLPSLEEFGPEVIYSNGSNYKWLFYKPTNPSPLDLFIIEDNNDKIVLFYGSLYSGSNFKTLSRKLLAVNSQESLMLVLRDFSGVFTGLVHLKSLGTTYAFIDQMGVKKLFFRTLENKIVFSSHAMLISNFCNIRELSNFAFGSVLFSSYIFADSVFDSVSQVSAACFVKVSNSSSTESEYVQYPTRSTESFSSSIQRVKEAHIDFWKRISSVNVDDITLFLSRGKDARVILKYMLDTGITPKLLSFFRRNNTISPFVSYLLETREDFEAAARISDEIGLPLTELNIPNLYLLNNLDRIVELNHGTPLNWEFLAAASKISNTSKYAVTGFVGDAIAGKSHHYYLFNKIKSSLDYAKLEFNTAGSSLLYNKICDVLTSSGFGNLPSIDELFLKWKHQYSICQSEDLNLIFQQGLLRTRGLGRVGPTFDQMRLFTRPIYPYNDNAIINAYRTIPEKYLIWEKTHVAQIAFDSRFNSINSTRLKVSVKAELNNLKIIGLLRRLDTFKKRRKRVAIIPSVIKDTALKQALLKLGLDELVWNQFDKLPKTPGFYNSISNLIAALRIKESLSKSVPKAYVQILKDWRNTN